MKAEKKPLNDFGLTVKHELVDLNRTQRWLIEETKKQLPHRYLDSSYLQKLMVGEVHSEEAETAFLSVLAMYSQS